MTSECDELMMIVLCWWKGFWKGLDIFTSIQITIVFWPSLSGEKLLLPLLLNKTKLHHTSTKPNKLGICHAASSASSKFSGFIVLLIKETKICIGISNRCHNNNNNNNNISISVLISLALYSILPIQKTLGWSNKYKTLSCFIVVGSVLWVHYICSHYTAFIFSSNQHYYYYYFCHYYATAVSSCSYFMLVSE